MFAPAKRTDTHFSGQELICCGSRVPARRVSGEKNSLLNQKREENLPVHGEKIKKEARRGLETRLMWEWTHSCSDLSRSALVAVPRSESQGCGGTLSEPKLEESWDELVVLRLSEDAVSLALPLALPMGRADGRISISSDSDDWDAEPSDAFLSGSDAGDSGCSQTGHRPDRDSGVTVHSFNTADL